MEHPVGCACETCFPKMLRRSELRGEAAGLVIKLEEGVLEEALAYLRDLAERERTLDPA